MAAVDDLAALWFRHQVTIHVGAGKGPYGDVPGTPVSARGYVRQETRRVEGPTGQQIVTDTTIRLPIALLDGDTPVTVTAGDRVDLPAPFIGTWEVTDIAILHGAGQDTPDHQKLTLKAMP